MHKSLQNGYKTYLERKNNNQFVFNNKTYKLIKIKTPIFTEKDNLFEYIENNIIKDLQKNDIITIAESILAITQGRAYTLEEIKPSIWAYLLYPWVSNVNYGTGLGMAETMECAIREIGVKRILKATLFGAMDRLKKQHGSFYRIAGESVKSIDFKKEHPIPFKNSHNYIVLSPSKPFDFAKKIYKELGFRCGIVDANNVSVDILGYYPNNLDFKNFLIQAMKGNPAGQEGEKTGIIIIREINEK